MLNFRTDLALEAQEMYVEANRKTSEIEGVAVTSKNVGKVLVTEVKITSENGEKSLGKPCGTYITMESPSIPVSYTHLESCIQYMVENDRETKRYTGLYHQLMKLREAL